MATMIATPAAAAPAPHAEYPARLPTWRVGAYGFGQFGEGLQGATIQLMLFFYTQVIGLNAATVGTAMLLAGLFDGVMDALAGSWTDATRSRWGRRHPYLYISAFPAALSLVMLFAVPSGLSHAAMLAWLFVWSLTLRTAMTFYLIPHWALGVDLAMNPRDRAPLVAARIFFSFAGSAGMFVISLLFFGQGSGAAPLLSPEPYLDLAIFIGIAALVAKVSAGAATHKYIPVLPQAAPDVKALSPIALWREVRELFVNRAFLIFFFGSLIAALGLSARVLDIYVGTYFWKLPTSLTLILPGASTMAFALGTFAWAPIGRRFGIKRCYILGTFLSGVVAASLPLAKVSGFFVSDTSVFYFPIIVTGGIVAGLLGSSGGVFAGITLGIVADDYERQTGRRMAGIIAGFLMFNSKCGIAASQLIASGVIAAIGLKPRALPSEVSAWAANTLGLTAGAISLTAGIAFLLVFSRFPSAAEAASKG